MAGRGERGEPTREALLRAAEKLMAEHGVDGVDLAAVQLMAGARNRSAIQYHFQNREGLVEAVQSRHRKYANEKRMRMLDRLERTGKLTPEGLVDALVLPAADHLKSESGRSYLIIVAQTNLRWSWPQMLLDLPVPFVESISRWATLVDSQLALTPSDRRLRIAYTALLFTILLADAARDLNAGDITERQAQLRVRYIRGYLLRGLFGENPSDFSTDRQ
jgi:AcrR family transcriptional regulator